ncbi:MAG: flagellar hook protein FlgE [Alphaproteobacteria bacterium]|nr:flagellar hook protein FlgE [Alphaproteobacteria bacterium]
MSLYDAMMIGVSGLNAQSRAMSVFSSNIANVNTVGYKTSQSVFETMLGSANGGSAGLATGVMASSQANIAQQGAEFATSSPTDLAINGNGFFCVSTSADSVGQMLFTRAGSFAPDANGELKNAAGLYLLGYPLGTDGAPTSSSLGAINLNGIGGKGEATTKMSIDANLDASADITTGYQIGDMQDGTVTPQFQTTVNVYDSQGGTQPLKVSYVKTGANTWQYEVSYAGDETKLTTPTNNPNNIAKPTDPNPISSGVVTFNPDGSLADVWPTGVANDPKSGTFDLTIPWDQSKSGLLSQTVSVDLGTVNSADGMSQFASDSVLNGSKADGAVFGNATGLSVGTDGVVTANFSNGLTQAVYQVPLATFANQNGLTLVGGNAFAQSGQSGTPRVNPADTAGSGTLQSYALEGSTVDLATEFTSMITTQQAYSASARVVSTASQMMDELMQMQH